MHAAKPAWPIWILPFLFVIPASGARADENFFGYSYGTETLPKGAFEFYNWLTWRTSKGAGTYNALDVRQELEYGITDRFQASLYLNERYHAIHDSAPIEDEDGVPTPEYPNRDQFAFDGVQTSFKYSFLSPYKDPLGFALYVEPGWSQISKESGQHENAFSLEMKALFQKNFLDDTLIAVLNISPEYEVARPRGSSSWEKELELEFTGGLTYRVAPKWYVGFETRYDSEYPEFPTDDLREDWAVFLGPVVHYATERWWATLTALPQIFGGPQDDERSQVLDLHEHERFELRLKTGINF